MSCIQEAGILKNGMTDTLKNGLRYLLIYGIAIAIITITYFFQFSDPLRITDELKVDIELIKQGDAAQKGKAIIDIGNMPATDSAPVVPFLITLLADETPLAGSMPRDLKKERIAWMGPLAMQMTDDRITLGLAAAQLIKKIRGNLVMESSATDGPSHILRSVRKELDAKLPELLCSDNKILKARMLVLLMGDPEDPAPIAGVISCGLSDNSPDILFLSAGLFMGYGYTYPKACLPAVPHLIMLLSHPQKNIAEAAHGSLAVISGSDFGMDKDRWTHWLASKK
jgi:hypothetical protein